MKLTAVQLDRAAGVLIGMACGDALGAGYEFGPRVPYTEPIAMAGGRGWKPGEWTDDTDMAWVIADAAHRHGGLDTEASLDDIVHGWSRWAAGAHDVGIQTGRVLARIREQDAETKDGLATLARASAAALHERTQMTAGNGSLMRTAPVALAYLHDPDALWQRAQEISALTHHDPVAGEACALWCLAIRHAVLEGTADGVRLALQHLPQERADYWAQLLDEAEARQPWEFPHNGWVVHALQAAWSAITHTPAAADRPDVLVFPAQSARAAIEHAARVGLDTDTVAAIAGSLVGALWGMSALPAQWLSKLHGFPGINANHLQHLAHAIVHRSTDPLPQQFCLDGYSEADAAGRIKGVEQLLLGGQQTFRDSEARRAVSLSRVGITEAVRPDGHTWVWVIDSQDAGINRHLHFQYHDVAGLLDEWLSETDVILHCVQAHNRTPCFAAAYLILRRGYSFDDAVAAVRQALPRAHMEAHLLEPLRALPTCQGACTAEQLGVLERGRTTQGREVLALRHPNGDLWRRGGVWVTPWGELTESEPIDLPPLQAVAEEDERELGDADIVAR